MTIIKIAALATTIIASSHVNAAIVTYGDLTSDTTTNFITDTATGREYLRFDTFDLTYANTLAAISSGGLYEGWNIATSQVADEFINAALGTNSLCDGATSNGTFCGTISGWVDGIYGSSFGSQKDYFSYISTNNTPSRPPAEAGTMLINANGNVFDYDDWTSFAVSDTYTVANGNSINYLLYKAPTVVPVPAAVWLFGSGLICLLGLARRKMRA